ncbi:unnamed protein product, partial [Protopolystoma xenopodis]
INDREDQEEPQDDDEEIDDDDYENDEVCDLEKKNAKTTRPKKCSTSIRTIQHINSSTIAAVASFHRNIEDGDADDEGDGNEDEEERQVHERQIGRNVPVSSAEASGSCLISRLNPVEEGESEPREVIEEGDDDDDDLSACLLGIACSATPGDLGLVKSNFEFPKYVIYS